MSHHQPSRYRPIWKDVLISLILSTGAIALWGAVLLASLGQERAIEILHHQFLYLTAIILLNFTFVRFTVPKEPRT